MLMHIFHHVLKKIFPLQQLDDQDIASSKRELGCGASPCILKRRQYIPLTNASRQTPRWNTQHGFYVCLPLGIAGPVPKNYTDRLLRAPRLRSSPLNLSHQNILLHPLKCLSLLEVMRIKIWYGNGEVWCSGLFSALLRPGFCAQVTPYQLVLHQAPWR